MFEELWYQGGLFFLLAGVLPLIIASLTGLIVGILQAATQIQEQTTSFLLKTSSAVVVLIFIGPTLQTKFGEIYFLALKLFNG